MAGTYEVSHPDLRSKEVFFVFLKNEWKKMWYIYIMEYYSTLEKEMATHSGILAWKIPWTEEPGRLQSVGLQRVRHDSVTLL